MGDRQVVLLAPSLSPRPIASRKRRAILGKPIEVCAHEA